MEELHEKEIWTALNLESMFNPMKPKEIKVWSKIHQQKGPNKEPQGFPEAFETKEIKSSATKSTSINTQRKSSDFHG